LSDLSGLSGTAPANDDPTNNRAYRVAKAATIILGVLIALAFSALVIGFILRLTGHRTSVEPAAEAPQMYQLKTGAKITDMKIDTGHVILRIKTDQGEEIEIIDEASGRVVSRIVAPK
jgi:hypothetical protein